MGAQVRADLEGFLMALDLSPLGTPLVPKEKRDALFLPGLLAAIDWLHQAEPP